MTPHPFLKSVEEEGHVDSPLPCCLTSPPKVCSRCTH